MCRVDGCGAGKDDVKDGLALIVIFSSLEE